MKQEDDNDETDNDCFFRQITLKGGNRIVDEARSVIARDDLYSGWKRWRNLAELLLHPFDDVQGIHALPHHHDAAHRLPLPVPFGDAFADVWTEGDTAEVPQEDRSAVLAAHGDQFQVIE